MLSLNFQRAIVPVSNTVLGKIEGVNYIKKKQQVQYILQGGPKVSLHTLGLIPTSCFLLEGCCFSDGILYLLVRGFRRQKFKIRIF